MNVDLAAILLEAKELLLSNIQYWTVYSRQLLVLLENIRFKKIADGYY